MKYNVVVCCQINLCFYVSNQPNMLVNIKEIIRFVSASYKPDNNIFRRAYGRTDRHVV